MALGSAPYLQHLADSVGRTAATDADGNDISLDDAVQWGVAAARGAHDAGNKIMFIGNGGSAGIASHLAIDYTKNGGMRSTAYNDGAALTCLANDLGYEQVFSKQLEMHARSGDLLIAISSSGGSQNILNGVSAARDAGCSVITLSGFSEDNPLRKTGDVNLYVPSGEYGFVEISHLTLGHLILDIAMGWGHDDTPGFPPGTFD